MKTNFAISGDFWDSALNVVTFGVHDRNVNTARDENLRDWRNCMRDAVSSIITALKGQGIDPTDPRYANFNSAGAEILQEVDWTQTPPVFSILHATSVLKDAEKLPDSPEKTETIKMLSRAPILNNPKVTQKGMIPAAKKTNIAIPVGIGAAALLGLLFL